MTLQEFVVALGFDVDEGGVTKIKETMNKAATNVKEGIQKINNEADKVESFGDRIKDGIQKGVLGIKETLSDIPLPEGLSNAFDKAKDVVDIGIQNIKLGFEKIKDVGAKINLNPMVEGFKDGFRKAQDVVKRGSEAIKGQLNKLGTSIKKFGKNVSDSFKKTFNKRNLLKITALTTGAVIGINKLVSGFTDLNRETYSEEKALSIMGKTLDEIQADPKLLKQFQELKKVTDSIGLPPEFQEGVDTLDNLRLQVNKLKVAFDIFLKWVGYHILRYLQKPIEDVRKLIQQLTEWLGKNTQRIAETIGKVVGRIARIITNVVKAITKIIQSVINILDKIPDNIKKIGLAVSAFFLLFLKNPVVAVLTLILLLIDDLITYLEGGESALGGFWAKAIEVFNELKDKYGPKVREVFDKIVESIQNIITWLKGLDWGRIVELGIQLAKIGAIIFAIIKVAGFIIKVVGVVKTIISVVVKLFGILSKVFGIISSIVGAIAAFVGLPAWVVGVIIAAIVALIALIIKYWDQIKEFFKNLWKSIKDIFGKIGDWFGEKFRQAKEAIINAFGAISDWFGEKVQAIKDLFASIGEWFSEKFTEAKEAIIEAFGSISEWFGEKVQAIKNFFLSIPTFLSNKFKEAVNKIKKVFEPLVNWFKDKTDQIKGFFTGIGDGIKEVGSNIGGAVGGAWDTVTGWFGGGHAEGGIFNQEHVARFAEGNKAEAVIPLESNKQRGIELTKRVNRMLGIDNEGQAISQTIGEGFNSVLNGIDFLSKSSMYANNIGASNRAYKDRQTINNINERKSITNRNTYNINVKGSNDPEKTATTIERKIKAIEMDNIVGVY